MGRTHHNALKHGLAAHKGFLAAFERRQKLDCHKKPPHCSQKAHGYWMSFPRQSTTLRVSQAELI
jgi:hypothetical protein